MPVVGSARGEAKATFLFSTNNQKIEIPAFSLNGFSQRSEKSPAGILVEVKATADPLRIEKVWHLNKVMERSLTKNYKKRATTLIESLSKARFLDEAVILTFNFIKNNWRYVEKNDAEVPINDIFNSNEASCLSICRICKEFFKIMDIQSEIVIGIKFPDYSDTLVLKGGALHSWIKIKIDDKNEIFCDPLSYFGFVTQKYIYLTDYDTFIKNHLADFKGISITMTKNKDRIFYNPESETKPQYWRRSPYETSVYGLFVGKILKEKDLPAKGTVIVKGFGGDLKTDLFNGNFYFFVRSEGQYFIFAVFEDGKEQKLGDITFSGVAVQKVVFYVKNNI